MTSKSKIVRKRIAVGYAILQAKGQVKLEMYKNLGDQWFFLSEFDLATIAALLGFKLVEAVE